MPHRKPRLCNVQLGLIMSQIINGLSGAIVVMILNVLTIISLFYGYWQLGRSVSMSSIELAKAFGVPLMRGGDYNEEATGLLEIYGQKKVRCGVILGSEERRI